MTAQPELVPGLLDLKEKLEKRKVKLSYSSLKAFAKSPRHFLEYKLAPKKATQAMNEGSLVDCLITEPGKFKEYFTVIPDEAAANSKEGISIYAQALGLNLSGLSFRQQQAMIKAILEDYPKAIINNATLNAARDVVERLKNNRASGWIFEEQPDYQSKFEFEFMGWTIRGARDIYKPGFFCADLKKMADPNPRKARRQAKDLMYDLQGGIYTYQQDIPYYIVCFGMDGHITVLQMRRAELEHQVERMAFLIRSLEKCIALDQWDMSYDFWPSNHMGIYNF